ncbi:MAG: hypothetical protein IJX98_06645 [Clostridia bacterium]|nr:hypothetical protein [Clostridia bacterium]
MDTANQWNIFFACVLIGFVGGVLYELASLPVSLAGNREKLRSGVRFAMDLLFFAAFAVLCTVAGNLLGFPALREYYYLGFALGMILYLKTFHKAVAFFKNICYNAFRKVINRLKNSKNFRKRKEKGL